jgi:hypothetical protein
MDPLAKPTPEMRALTRLLEKQSGRVMTPGFMPPDIVNASWQAAFGPDLDAFGWSEVLHRLEALQLVHVNGGGGHLFWGLTPVGAMLAKRLKASSTGLLASVFISHSHKDTDFCERLDSDLSRQGYQTWFDLNTLGVGDSIVEKIDYGLKNSEYVVIVYSQHAAASAWVRREYQSALAMEVSGEIRKIIVVRIDDTESPPLLKDKRFLRFQANNYADALRELVRALESS